MSPVGLTWRRKEAAARFRHELAAAHAFASLSPFHSALAAPGQLAALCVEGLDVARGCAQHKHRRRPWRCALLLCSLRMTAPACQMLLRAACRMWCLPGPLTCCAAVPTHARQVCLCVSALPAVAEPPSAPPSVHLNRPVPASASCTGRQHQGSCIPPTSRLWSCA